MTRRAAALVGLALALLFGGAVWLGLWLVAR